MAKVKQILKRIIEKKSFYNRNFVLGEQEKVTSAVANLKKRNPEADTIDKYEIGDSLPGSYAYIKDNNYPTLILYPPNGGVASKLFVTYYNELQDKDINLVVINYYGNERTTESTLKAKIEGVNRYLEEAKIPTENQYICGKSLGCALATYHIHSLETAGKTVGGGVVDSPFVSSSRAVSGFMTTKFHVPKKIADSIGRVMGEESWNNVTLAKAINAPLTVLSPRKDSMVPPEQHEEYSKSRKGIQLVYYGTYLVDNHASAPVSCFYEQIQRMVQKKEEKSEVKEGKNGSLKNLIVKKLQESSNSKGEWGSRIEEHKIQRVRVGSAIN